MDYGIHRRYKLGEERLQLSLCCSAEDETAGLDLKTQRKWRRPEIDYLVFWQAWLMVEQGASAQVGCWDTVMNGTRLGGGQL